MTDVIVQQQVEPRTYVGRKVALEEITHVDLSAQVSDGPYAIADLTLKSGETFPIAVDPEAIQEIFRIYDSKENA